MTDLFLKYLQTNTDVYMTNRNWYRQYKLKTVENDVKNNSETQEKDQSKSKINVEISKSVTKKVKLIWSTVQLVLQKIFLKKKLCAAQMKVIKW